MGLGQILDICLNLKTRPETIIIKLTRNSALLTVKAILKSLLQCIFSPCRRSADPLNHFRNVTVV